MRASEEYAKCVNIAELSLVYNTIQELPIYDSLNTRSIKIKGVRELGNNLGDANTQVT